MMQAAVSPLQVFLQSKGLLSKNVKKKLFKQFMSSLRAPSTPSAPPAIPNLSKTFYCSVDTLTLNGWMDGRVDRDKSLLSFTSLFLHCAFLLLQGCK